MSRHHGSNANEVTRLIHDVVHTDKDDVENIYGIEIFENGEVRDPMYGMTFSTLGEWAQFSVEQESAGEDSYYTEYDEDDFY